MLSRFGACNKYIVKFKLLDAEFGFSVSYELKEENLIWS